MKRASMQVAIDTLTVDLGERMYTRTTMYETRQREEWARSRASDIEAIRGLVRAIRVLRAAAEVER